MEESESSQESVWLRFVVSFQISSPQHSYFCYCLALVDFSLFRLMMMTELKLHASLSYETTHLVFWAFLTMVLSGSFSGNNHTL